MPNYDPMDIIENIRRKLQGWGIKEMNPCYRRFKGFVEGIEQGRHTVSGIIDEVDETTTDNRASNNTVNYNLQEVSERKSCGQGMLLLFILIQLR